MTIIIDKPNHVRFRAIAITSTKTATPEIREIATVDPVWERDACSFDSAELHQFSTSADEHVDALPACNPSHQADVIWGSPPNVVVVHDRPTAQLVIPLEFTRNLPWVDTYRVARVLWPGLGRREYELGQLVESLALRPFVDAHVSGSATRSAAAWDVVATAALLSVELQFAREREPLLSRDDERLIDLYRPLSAPAWMQTLADISRQPAPPLRELPAAWDEDADWATFGAEDLAWALADEGAICSRPALLREIERRRRRAEERPFPLILCRMGSSREE